MCMFGLETAEGSADVLEWEVSDGWCDLAVGVEAEYAGECCWVVEW